MLRPRFHQLAIVAASIGFTACSAGASSEPTGANPTTTAPPALVPAVTVTGAHLPPESLYFMVLLGPTLEEQRAWDLGDAASVQRCLLERGYDIVPSIAPLVLPREVWLHRVERLYFDDQEMIRQFGYFWPEPDVNAEAESSNDTSVPFEAFDECSSQARDILASLQSELGEDYTGVQQLDTQMEAAQEVAPELDQARALQDRCLEAAGFEVNRDQPDPAQATVERAFADSACRQSTGYTTAIVSWRASYINAWIEANPTRVTEFRQFWVDLAEAGTELLAG